MLRNSIEELLQLPDYWADLCGIEQQDTDVRFQAVSDSKAHVEDHQHRFVIETATVEKEDGTERFFLLSIEGTMADDPDGEDRIPFHVGKDVSVTRNNIYWARRSLQTDTTPHVVVIEEGSGREVYDLPSRPMATRAASLQQEARADQDDARVYADTKSEWEAPEAKRGATAIADGGEIDAA